MGGLALGAFTPPAAFTVAGAMLDPTLGVDVPGFLAALLAVTFGIGVAGGPLAAAAGRAVRRRLGADWSEGRTLFVAGYLCGALAAAPCAGCAAALLGR